MIEERVRTLLAVETRFDDIRLMDKVDSTNRVVAELADSGAPEGLVVAADVQTAGRGRLDRRWEADRGAALLVSLLLRPSELAPGRWHLLTAAAALAAREACRLVAGVAPEVKWPNDLLVDNGKLAGILAEAAGGAVVVGMGLNVHAAPPGGSHLDAAAGRRTSRSELLVAWLRLLDGLLGDWDAVAGAYRDACATIGREVIVDQAAGARLVGRAYGVDTSGRLLVRDATGTTTAVSAGDITHVRPVGGAW